MPGARADEMLRSLVSGLVLCAACVSGGPDPGAGDAYDLIDPGAGGGADGAGFPVLEVEPGDQVSLEVAALPAGAGIDDVELSDHVVAVRVHGGPVALIVRRTSDTLDAYAIVKDGAKRTLATSVDQVVAPAADASDAIVTVTSSDQLALISGESLASGGRFTLSVVALPVPIAMALESIPATVIGADLRALEPSRSGFVASGWIAERADGGLDELLPSIPLDQRTRVRSTVAALMSARTALFSELAPETPAAAAANLAAIWAATRTP